jgi:3-methylfumaryl-CoA hydratase|tara:strand:- start:2722 stop:3159 length:438 start_codon:yes stop_codon:yes gene_type:complete
MTVAEHSQRFTGIQVGDSLPEREFDCDNVQLMLYNAVLWNGHRIHFDEPYTKNVEGYPGLVLAGPMLGDWLHQCVEEWLGDDGRIVSIDYSNRIAAYVGDILTSGATVIAVRPAEQELDIEVFIKNKEGVIAAPGTMVVRFGECW